EQPFLSLRRMLVSTSCSLPTCSVFRTEFMFLVLLSSVALLCYRNHSSQGPQSFITLRKFGCMDPRIELAIKIMHVESRQKVAICQVARRVNLSPWHFAHLFKRETSLSA